MNYLKIAGIFCLLLTTVPTFAQNHVAVNQPGQYRLQIGDAQVYALLDGHHAVNVRQLLHGISPDAISGIMHQNGLDTNYQITFSAFLIKIKDQRILVDAGCGTFMGPGAGQLVENLHGIGIEPREITSVLITHGHGDHLGGLVYNGRLVFPNATVYLNKSEADYWLSPSQKKAASKDNRPIFDMVETALRPYIKAGKLKTFVSGEGLPSGISTVNMHGHTPGSTAYQLESRGQHILFVGDIAHIAAIQFSHPKVTIDFDIDQPAAARTRMHEFEILAKKGYWVAAPHMPFPGLGHIQAVGNAYKWQPLVQK